VLVLSRKTGEKVVVPRHGLEIRVLEIRGNKVRLGITAPRDMEVYREEIWERIQGAAADTDDAATTAQGGHDLPVPQR
jgi:carbon storage regulator